MAATSAVSIGHEPYVRRVLEMMERLEEAEKEHARKQGRRIGRPSVWTRKGFKRRFGDILERLADGSLSRRQAALELGIGYATLKRLLDEQQRRNQREQG